jgi:branched-chain amino acid transport system permease protein
LLLQFLVNAIVAGSIFALVALGFGLIYNCSRIFHFAHAGVYTASAYVLYFVVARLHWNLIAGLAAGVAFAAVLGIGLERYVYAPLRRQKASPTVILVSSIGATTVIVNVVAAAFGNEGQTLFPGPGTSLQLGTARLTQIQVVQMAVSLTACAVLVVVLKTTQFGRMVRALADDPPLLSALGVDAQKMTTAVFAIGSAFAGVAACLVAVDMGMDPYGGLAMLLTGAVAVILAGLRRIEGAVVGAFVLALVQSLTVYQVSARWEQSVTFVILIVALLFRPTGLLKRVARVDAL